MPPRQRATGVCPFPLVPVLLHCTGEWDFELQKKGHCHVMVKRILQCVGFYKKKNSGPHATLDVVSVNFIFHQQKEESHATESFGC